MLPKRQIGYQRRQERKKEKKQKNSTRDKLYTLSKVEEVFLEGK